MNQGDGSLREYREADLDAVLECFTKSVRSIGARYYTKVQVAVWAPESPDREAWMARLRAGRTLIADVDGVVAGFARVEERGYIDLLYIHPQFERRGLGRRLLKEACAWAVSAGAEKLESDVSIAARALFEALGFAVENEQSVERRGVRLTNYRMSRRPTA